MPATPNTFIVAPVRYGATLASRPKSMLMRVADFLAAGSVTAPTDADKIGLWLTMQEWSNRNVAALEGLRTGHAARSAAAGEIDDESSRG